MNGQTLVERVREEKRTELERLKSDKALIAATEAALEPSTVLAVVVETERTLESAYGEWAERAATDEAADAFADAARTAGQNADRLAAALDSLPEARDLTAPLDVDVTLEAVAAGLVGQSLVLDGTLLQAINFFVNEADERRADLVRDVRTSVNARLNDGAVALNGLCENDAEWTQAETAVTEVVDAAYADYAETLGAMGIDPKPVC
ncbi:hypothetical protein ACFR9U_12010 [Halorientalis brevis]|uniref:Uncharacterized protein n=1 Tax=Halorientalis brevis TaxID=1126241 RepID=A0ABD6CDQ3_9EURY|nr:hypothetical protein [Halorientalis brevis]